MATEASSADVRTVRSRYLYLLQRGLTTNQSAALLAFADGITRYQEGTSPDDLTWSWREVAGLEFIRYLVVSGRMTGDHAPASGPARGLAGASRNSLQAPDCDHRQEGLV